MDKYLILYLFMFLMFSLITISRIQAYGLKGYLDRRRERRYGLLISTLKHSFDS